MKNILTKILATATLVAVLPAMVNAETIVNDEEELLKALEGTETEIVLGADIETKGKINILKDVTIDGQGHSITYTGKFYATSEDEGSYDNTIWSKKSENGVAGAVYVIQAYTSNVTLKDIVLSGGNRGLGINGANVTLEGSIGFVNNGFQDIELSHGTAVDEAVVSKLTIADDAIIVADEEVTGEVTSYLIYVDDATAIINDKSYEAETSLRLSELSSDSITIYPNTDEEKKISEDVFTNIKENGTNVGFGFVDDEGNFLYTWEFAGSDITTPMEVDTKITFTTEAPEPIREDLSKLVTTYKDVTYINFSHNGSLPGKATVSYYVGSEYATGTTLTIAHYNETTKELENVTTVVVDEEGYVTFDITECSSYVLYTSNQDTNNTTTTTPSTTDEVKPAQTGDINLIVIASTILVAAIGVIVTSKKLATRN